MTIYSEKYEQQLVKSLSKGNILSFNTLFKNYSNRLYHFSLGYLKSEADAEEIVQEVFTTIWEKRGELKDNLSFKAYLFTIAFNFIKKHFRAKAQLSRYFNSQVFNDFDFQTSQSISYENIQQYIKEIVNLLPDKRKEIFIKSRFEGKNIKEISKELNISHKTVENQLTHALKFVRTNLNRENLSVLLFFMLFIDCYWPDLFQFTILQ